MPIEKPIKISDIPEAQKLGAKESKVPEILKLAKKGEALPITNTFIRNETMKWETKDTPRISTVRSFLTKQHKKGHYTQYTMEQRVSYPQEPGTKIITLYIAHN